MSWFFLVAAIAFEVSGTIAAKQTNGYTNLTASALMLVFYALSLSGLALATKSIEISIAYPVWTGAAVLILSVLSVILFHESISQTPPAKLVA